MNATTPRVTAIAAGVLLLTDTLRVYLPSVTNIYGVAAETSAYQLGGFAALWFALAFAAVPLVRYAGARPVAYAGAAVLGVARLALQATGGGDAQLYLACAALLGGLIWLAATAATAIPGRTAAIGLAAGLAAASVTHAALGTRDLMWRPGAWAWAAVAAEVLIFAAAVALGPRESTPGAAPGAVWFLALPALGAAAMVFGAPARAEAALPTSWHAASALVACGAVAGVGAAAYRRWTRVPYAPAAGAVLAMPVALLARTASGGVPGVLPWWAVAGQVVGAVSLGGCLAWAGARDRAATGPRRTLAVALGGLVLFVVIFGFYAAYDTDIGIPNHALPIVLALVIAAVAIGRARPAAGGARPGRRARAALGGAAVAAALLVVVGAVATPRGGPVGRTRTGAAFRLVTYNIRMGIGLSGRFGIDRIAAAIAAQHPDVVLLNEVDRGWLLNGGHDDVGLLARRLGMRPIFAPAADEVWGDAVLTRLPVTSVRGHPLAAHGAPTGAQALAVTVRAGNRQVGVVATHLQPPPDAPPTAQAARVARIAGDLYARTGNVVVAGDLNAEPGGPAIRALGLTDALAGRRPLPTFPCDRPVQQIDHVRTRGGLGAERIAVARVPYSDHCPVAVTLGSTRPVR